jgi:hypothetical protein
MRPNPAGHTPSARRLLGPPSCEPRLRPDQEYLRYPRLPQLRGTAFFGQLVYALGVGLRPIRESLGVPGLPC